MKKWKKALAVLTATMALAIGGATMAYAAEGEINVNGTGIVMANPDTADISVSIEATGKTSDAAQKENNKIVQKVTEAMAALGVTKDNIVTAYTSVYPQYQYDEDTGKSTIVGYRSNTDLKVTTKDIDHAGKYIDAALNAGATGSNGVNFSVANQSAYYAQALQAAAKNAGKSADAIAQAFGKPLGAVKSVNELSRNAYMEDYSNMMAKEAAMDGMGGGGSATSISYGKIQIVANISVVYGF